MNGHRSDDWEWQRFLGHIAGQVDELILESDNLSLFREMIRPLVEPWQQYYKQQQKEHDNVKETWEKVKADPKYQDKESGPPEEGYEWDDYYLFGVRTTNFIRIEGVILDDGPVYEMPMKYAEQYIKALETFIKRNTKRLEEYRTESTEGKNLQESISKQKRTIRIVKSQIRSMIAKDIKTARIRVPALWWRYLDMEDKEIFGCYRPKPSEMSEHPIIEKFKPPTKDSNGLPKPKNKKEEYERYYCVLTSIHDNKLPGCQSISDGIWPEELANQLWGRFSWARPYGPSKHFINATLNRVKADLKKPRGKSGRGKKEITKKITEDELSKRIQPDKAPALNAEQRTALLGIADDVFELADYIEKIGSGPSTLDEIDELRKKIVCLDAKHGFYKKSKPGHKLQSILKQILPHYRSFPKEEGPPESGKTADALREEAKKLRSLAGWKGTDKKRPVSKRAGLILEKLRSLPEHEAMLTPALLAWLSREHKIDIDDKTLRRHLKELEPYGLENIPKIGYFIR